MLETNILDQVRSIFQPLEARYTFHITCNPKHEQARELIDFLNEIASCSDKLSCRLTETETSGPEFTLLKEEQKTGIKFRAIPGGHEFSSLLLAVLNADGKGKNLPDESIGRRIRALKGTIRLQTYVSLTCTNCPDIVQALNIMALLNPHITHEMIDGALFQEEADALKIQAVPSVYANGKQFHVGRGSLGELLQKLEDTFGSLPQEDAAPVPRKFDLLVLGGGPAGTSAAIYSARKGLRVAIIAERIGGQVKETVGIENLISIPQTTGSQLADALKNHIGHYPVEVFENRRIEKAELQGKEKKVFSGEVKFTNDEMTKLVQSSPDKRQDVFAEIMHPEITKAMEAADAEPNADTPVPMPTADPEQFKTYQVPDEFMRVYKTLSTATEMMTNTWKRVLKNNQSYLSDPEKQKVLRFAMQRPALYLNELEACMEQILAETLEEAEKTA